MVSQLYSFKSVVFSSHKLQDKAQSIQIHLFTLLWTQRCCLYALTRSHSSNNARNISACFPRSKGCIKTSHEMQLLSAVQQCAAHGSGRTEGLCHRVQPFCPARNFCLVVPRGLQALVWFPFCWPYIPAGSHIFAYITAPKHLYHHVNVTRRMFTIK
jgi:hypothetical protein